MTNQQIANELLSQWQQLWPLTPSERLKHIDQIADEAYDQELQRMTVAPNLEEAA
jgi:hypothetical protein